MRNPLHAPHLADRALQRTVPVVQNVRLARDTFRVRVACPEIAERVVPGQFLMFRLTDRSDPLLGRPFALYDTVVGDDGQIDAVDVVYLVIGRMTRRLAKAVAGDRLEVWGPLGNGFPIQRAEHLIMVAGGIGQTPFPALAREHLGLRTYGSPTRQVPSIARATLCYGARNERFLAGIADFKALGVDVRVSTDDGSRGHHGLVTDVLQELLADRDNGRRIVACGPEPMLRAVAQVAAEAEVPCQVSLETPMACGIGICSTCVAKVRDASGDWDYKRTCVDGPVFDAEKIVW